MMKKYIIIGVIIVVVIGVYYTGVYTYFFETRVDEEIPDIDTVAKPTMTPTRTQSSDTMDTPASQPQITTLKQGNFVDADFFHKGSGQATILQYPDGRKILRFENFETINGPDLFVYLSTTDSPTGDLNSLGNYIDLGMLKGNVGNQNYEITDNVDISGYKSAIIWCKQFGVLFPYAILR